MFFNLLASNSHSATEKGHLSREQKEFLHEITTHSENVSFVAARLAATLGWSKEDQERIQWAGYFHDFGKHSLDPMILLKRTPLTPDDWLQIKQHPELGFQSFIKMHKQSKSKPDSLIAKCILQHHERWDGTGYPYELCDEEISSAALIVSFADVVDALLSDRSYRKKFSYDKMCEHIEERRDKQWPAFIVDAFFKNQFFILSSLLGGKNVQESQPFY
jgi:HD-GYP domain-containing protein (c-di-GMP phosphodiesterase class II)